MTTLIPIISSLLFRLGGSDDLPYIPFPVKWFRWLMGVPIALITGNWWVVPLYFIATNVISWGETHPLRKWVGKYWQWVIYGFCLGLASFPVLGWYSIIQAVIGSVSCVFFMTWSNDGLFSHWSKMPHKYVELLTGLLSTILYLST